jgi:hypothetical protein
MYRWLLAVAVLVGHAVGLSQFENTDAERQSAVQALLAEQRPQLTLTPLSSARRVDVDDLAKKAQMTGCQLCNFVDRRSYEAGSVCPRSTDGDVKQVGRKLAVSVRFPGSLRPSLCPAADGSGGNLLLMVPVSPRC